MLRDEIIYLAHKAANPAEYPVREGVMRDGLRQKENAHKFSTPTKVHLQVYDGTLLLFVRDRLLKPMLQECVMF